MTQVCRRFLVRIVQVADLRMPPPFFSPLIHWDWRFVLKVFL
jgi:hypothetical protein